MPEIWLNYGATEVVLEIMAENLEETINSGGSGSDNSMVSKVGSLGGESVMPPDSAGDDDGGGGGVGDDDDDDDDDGNGGTGDTAAEGGVDSGDTDGGDVDGTGHGDGVAGSGGDMPAEPAADNNVGTDALSDGDADGRAGAGGSSIDGADDNSSDGDAGDKAYDGVSVATAATAAPAGSMARARDHVSAPRQLESGEISDILRDIDVARPFDLVLLHDSQAVRQVVSSVFMMCEQRAAQFPGILADRDILPAIKPGLPEGSVAAEFSADVIGGGHGYAGRDGGGSDNNAGDAADLDAAGKKRNLIFVAEAEFDGLFGYETVSTRLLRRFGSDEMLAAYAKRDGNMPSPGRRTGSFAEAVKFADRFEIGGIDIVASSGGISDIFVGHPSETAAEASASLESGFMLDVERQRTLIASTGKASSNATLGDALSSVWNCHQAVRDRGLLVLVAECARGLGPDAIRMRVEGGLQPEELPNPSAYVDGMEELLFLQEVQKRCQVALVSVLPEMYTKRLGLVSLGGMQESVAYLKKTQGARQKASVVMDGSRLLLR